MKEKYISASALKAHYSWLGKDATLSPKDVDDIVDAQPDEDVEHVVRCGKCKCGYEPDEDGNILCCVNAASHDPMYYCSDGKERES